MGAASTQRRKRAVFYNAVGYVVEVRCDRCPPKLAADSAASTTWCRRTAAGTAGRWWPGPRPPAASGTGIG
jgi:hypothetical protein